MAYRKKENIQTYEEIFQLITRDRSLRRGLHYFQPGGTPSRDLAATFGRLNYAWTAITRHDANLRLCVDINLRYS